MSVLHPALTDFERYGDAEFWILSTTGANQYGRPIADLATTGWTVTPLWSKLDEAFADDADLVTGTAA